MKKVITQKIFAYILLFILFFSCFFATSCTASSPPSTINYDWFIDHLNLPQIWKRTTGKGVNVAVIDSGVDYGLLGSNFDRKRIIAAYNAFDDSTDIADTSLHGSSMLGIIGGRGEYNGSSENDRKGLYGVAPNCKFIAIKALDKYGTTTAEVLIKAVRFAIALNADVINMSLGRAAYNEPLAEELRFAAEQNIAIVCAVGDSEKDTAFFPAVLDCCLGVAASDENGKVYHLSNHGKGVDILAPGVNIKTVKYNYKGELVLTTRSGSSIASAVASGIIALYLEYFSELSVAEIYTKLKETKEINTNLISGG